MFVNRILYQIICFLPFIALILRLLSHVTTYVFIEQFDFDLIPVVILFYRKSITTYNTYKYVRKIGSAERLKMKKCCFLED